MFECQIVQTHNGLVGGALGFLALMVDFALHRLARAAREVSESRTSRYLDFAGGAALEEEAQQAEDEEAVEEEESWGSSGFTPAGFDGVSATCADKATRRCPSCKPSPSRDTPARRRCNAAAKWAAGALLAVTVVGAGAWCSFVVWAVSTYIAHDQPSLTGTLTLAGLSASTRQWVTAGRRFEP